ncbi:hypothetical protein CcI49_32900 [Frankia sp. CcI49]|nr:hypothetical protein CcI49_32900 [Frankia sp. CcI49]
MIRKFSKHPSRVLQGCDGIGVEIRQMEGLSYDLLQDSMSSLADIGNFVDRRYDFRFGVDDGLAHQFLEPFPVQPVQLV